MTDIVVTFKAFYELLAVIFLFIIPLILYYHIERPASVILLAIGVNLIIFYTLYEDEHVQ